VGFICWSRKVNLFDACLKEANDTEKKSKTLKAIVREERKRREKSTNKLFFVYLGGIACDAGNRIVLFQSRTYYCFCFFCVLRGLLLLIFTARQ